MKRLSLLTLIFAILSLVFFILLIFFRIPFPIYSHMSYQDAIDILTPVALIPIYWLLFRYSTSNRPSLPEEFAFVVLAALWVEGQGMHLSANSISNLIVDLPHNQPVDFTATDVFNLTYFFDEHLGHYLWHIGVLGLAALLIYREWRQPAGVATAWWAAVSAGLLYGFTYFAIFLEGQTLALGLPFAFLVVLFTLIWGRNKLARQPVLGFFFVACLVAALLFTAWGLYWGGFPQIMDALRI
jgi:hypothetical protein